MAHCVAPDPEVIAHALHDYQRMLEEQPTSGRAMVSGGQPIGGAAPAERHLRWREYLQAIGIAQRDHVGRDCASHPKLASDMIRSALAIAPTDGGAGPSLASLAPAPAPAAPAAAHAIVLLVDFPDLPGTRAAAEYHTLFFGQQQGSVRDFYAEVSGGRVDLEGTVHGWLRMPQNYSYYVNRQSGTGSDIERSSRGLASDAIKMAVAKGVVFDSNLAARGGSVVRALVLVHAGLGAEVMFDEAARLNNIWSHKWQLPAPVAVGPALTAMTYLVVPQHCKLGVCAHELGHLLFDWEDFYDPNYDDDGESWDGAGSWDLMASGSYNGREERPAHPAALHKLQHKWVTATIVTKTTGPITLSPNERRVVVVKSAAYVPEQQFLLLECRSSTKSNSFYESGLPGGGLLVWRIDLSGGMNSPTAPKMSLIQADGRKHLENAKDGNAGDKGDPFPGTSDRHKVGDDPLHLINTNFPDSGRSGVAIKNIQQDADSGAVTFNIVYSNASIGVARAPSGVAEEGTADGETEEQS
jgi:immune inhibitor A